MKHNRIGWVEIPVIDIERAATFYSLVLQISIDVMDMGPVKMAIMKSNHDAPGCSGSLVQYPDAYRPSDSHGPVVYFNSEDVNIELALIKAAGGKILREKTQISVDEGYMATFIDSEGNRMALRSDK